MCLNIDNLQTGSLCGEKAKGKDFAVKFYLIVNFFYPLNIMERIKVYW